MGRAEPPEVARFLAPFPEVVLEIVRGLRTQVLRVVPNAREFVWDATNAVSLAYTPTSRWQDAISHIAAYSKHANLGFNQGAQLDDPLGVLVGSGANVRHVSFRDPAATKARWVGQYLRAARDSAGMARTAGDGGTTIRVSRGPKRRPG